MMAHRSDREPGHPAECPRRHSLQSRVGPSSRIPSGPAVRADRTNRPDRRLHPTKRQNLKSPLATREPSTEDIRAGMPGHFLGVAAETTLPLPHA